MEVSPAIESWSVAVAKDEKTPAIESWSVVIRTEASRLELKHRRSEQKRRQRLNRCDQKQAEASPVFEASWSHSETSPASEMKRRNNGNGVTTASRSVIYGNGVTTAC